MTHTLFQALVDFMTSPAALTVGACCGALTAIHCGCGCGCGGGDDDHDDDAENADFRFSKEELKEYQEYVEQTNARINELVETLDDDRDAENKRELLDELIECYLSRAARLQEEGEEDAACDDYGAAFTRYYEFVGEFGESLPLLKRVAAGRLNYGILLNDCGDLDAADDEYARAEEANTRIAECGDKEAAIDLLGIRLNRASIAFERGDHAESFNALDEIAEEFRVLSEKPEYKESEALYYLAKTYATKASFLRATFDEDDLDSSEAAEASQTYRNAIDVYRALINGGATQYLRDLADGLVGYVAATATRAKEDLQNAEELLREACAAYQKTIALGEQDACVDLFDATLQRGELLMKLERKADAEKLYSSIIDAFETFGDSGELPLMEGLAIAYQRRAALQKGRESATTTIKDLSHAIALQRGIADSLIETLGEDGASKGSCGERCHCGDSCGCDSHDHKKCDCGPDCKCGCQEGKECTCGKDGKQCDCGPDCTCGCQEGKECTCGKDGKKCDCGPDCKCGCQEGKECTCGKDGKQCDCGPDCTCGCQEGKECTCGKDDKKCGCGCEEGDSCGCGSCGCGCGGEEGRKFLVKRWVNDNFRALTELYYERIQAFLERSEKDRAIADCMEAERLYKEYRAVLHDDEVLDEEYLDMIRTLRIAL